MDRVPNSLKAVALAAVVCLVLHSAWTKFAHASRSRRLGCKPAFVRPHRWPFGLDLLKRYLDTAKQDIAQNDDLVLYEELGYRSTWRQKILGVWHHVTAEPKNIQAMLATQFKDFELGPLRRGILDPMIGCGIFTTDGKQWEHSRAILRPQFARAQIADLDLLETHVQELFKRIMANSQNSLTGSVDLGPLFFNLTLDSATQFLFGQSVHSQSTSTSPTPEQTLEKTTSKDRAWSSFGPCFDRANQVVVTRARLFDLYFLYNPRQFRDDCAELHRFANQFVDLALESHSRANGDKGRHNAPAHQQYVFLHELVKSTQDRDELRSQMLNILLAGRDTTAGLLGWTVFHLARHPTIFQKLRETLVHHFGPYSSSTGPITFESLKSCTYLQHVMSEILRLHPIVPENARRAVRNTTLPRGGGPDGQSPIYIHAGEEVVYNVHMMHRRKDIWGEDANEFRPERWEKHRPGWEYIPFNAGPRICLGQQFALTEAGYVLTRLLQRFDRVENRDPCSIIKHRFANTTSPVQVLVDMHQAI